MKKIPLVSLLILGLALSCDVSSNSDKDCVDFFSCNEGIFEGDGEEGGIIDRYVIQIGEDLAFNSEEGESKEALVFIYYKFEDHPSFDNCYHFSPLEKADYTIEQNSETELVLTEKSTGIEDRFLREKKTMKWMKNYATITLDESDVGIGELNVCQE